MALLTRTCLPELLAIDPSSFNNTRLHRVLDELDAVTPSLMSRLPTLYLEHLRWLTVQFFTGVPAALVAVHVAGAAACTAATAALWASMRHQVAQKFKTKTWP